MPKYSKYLLSGPIMLFNPRLLLRLAKERLAFLRPHVVRIAKHQKQAKGAFARVLRNNIHIRKYLLLPAPDPFSWKVWLKLNPDKGFEIPIDHGGDFHIPLPEGIPLDMEWYFEQESKSHLQSSFVAGIKGGGVWNHHGGIYFSNFRELLLDLGREHWLDDLAGVPAALNRWHLPKPQTIAGTVAVLASPDAFANFGHWALDVLPLIGLLERAGWGPSHIDYYLVGHTGKDFQLQSLESLGIPLEKVLRMSDYQYLEADLLIRPFLNNYYFTSFQPSSVAYLRNKFLPNVDISPLSCPEKIFISRSDAKFRHVTNEDEIRDALEPLGFKFITLEGLNLQETARLLSGAKVIVSPNGSGLMCVMFAKPGAFVLEFSHSRYTTSFHWKLCHAAGLRYAHLVSDDEVVEIGSEQRFLYADLRINPTRLINALEKAGVL